jgi:hypothetical protein
MEQDLDRLDSELKELEDELATLSATDSAQNQARFVLEHLERKFHYVDFHDAERTLTEFLDEHVGQGCHQVFLIENGYMMGGKWCVRKVRDRLQYNLREGAWQPFEFVFDGDQRDAFLKKLAGRKKGALGESPDLLAEVTRALADSVRTGSVLFFEIQFRGPGDHAYLLDWFFDQFWKGLDAAIEPKRPTNPVIRCFALLHFLSPLGEPVHPMVGTCLKLPIRILDHDGYVLEWLTGIPCLEGLDLTNTARSAWDEATKHGYPRMYDYLSDKLCTMV